MLSPDEMKAIARRYYAELDRGNAAINDELRSPGYRYHGALHTGAADESPGTAVRIFYTAFPDFRHVIEDQIAEGDTVVERIRYVATHGGEFMGVPPTGRQVTWTGMDVVRFEGGLIAERWGEYDALGLLRQLQGNDDETRHRD